MSEGLLGILDKHGMPLAGLVAFSLFFIRYVWPFVIRQVEERSKELKLSQDRQHEMVREFTASLSNLQTTFQRAADKTEAAFERLLERLDARRH